MTCRKLVSSNSKMGPEKGRLMIMSQASIANFTLLPKRIQRFFLVSLPMYLFMDKPVSLEQSAVPAVIVKTNRARNEWKALGRQAKPSHAKVLAGGRRLALQSSRCPPVCQPFLRLTVQLGSITDTLTLTGDYAYGNDFKVRLKALTDLAKDQCVDGPGLIKGGINFGWLAVSVLSPDWLSCKMEVCDFCQALRRSRRALETGVRAVPRL